MLHPVHSLITTVCLFFFVYAKVYAQCPQLCQCYSSLNPSWVCQGVSSLQQIWSHEAVSVRNLTLVRSHLNDTTWNGSQFISVKHLTLQQCGFGFNETFLHSFPKLETLDISNNSIPCSNSLVWLLHWSSKILNIEQIQCTTPQPSNGAALLKNLKLISRINSECPSKCRCELSHVPKNDQYPTITVNCSHQGFNQLPYIFPADVTINLDLSHNEIENITKLVTDPIYLKIRMLNLASNNIKSIAVLENSEWIRHFSLLNLQRNNLTELPITALENAFRNKDTNGIRMFLGQNPWRCDCTTTTQFQSFIAKYQQLINDVNSIHCGSGEGGNAGKKMVSIEIGTVCSTSDGTVVNLMDILNFFLAFLTVATIGKLLYDYYAYRKTGRLPWLVSKMP